MDFEQWWEKNFRHVMQKDAARAAWEAAILAERQRIKTSLYNHHGNDGFYEAVVAIVEDKS